MGFPQSLTLMVPQGSKLGHCPKILAIFPKLHYAVYFTCVDAFYHNIPSDCPQQTIGDALRARLLGGALTGKFWPYAFDMYLRIHNNLPIQGTDDSPISHSTKH